MLFITELDIFSLIIGLWVCLDINL